MQRSGGWWGFGNAAEPHVSVEDAHAARPLWFADLIALMAPGAGEDRLRGDVLSHTDCHGVLRFRVSRRGRLVRCEDLSGAVIYIAGHDTVWSRDDRGGLVEERRRGNWFPIPDDFEFGARRLGRDRWRGDDFTRPTGPAREVSFLDRLAWEVELAPPPRKPHPMQLTVDQQTGLILRQGNAAFGTFTEWTSLDLAAELPDDLFMWHAGVDVPAPPPEPLVDPHLREDLQQQIHLLDGMLRAFDLFDEIWATTAEAIGFDRAAGAQVLTEKFGFTPAQARMITGHLLDPPRRKQDVRNASFAPRRRSQLATERQRMQDQLDGE